MVSAGKIIGVVVALLLMGVLLPIGLADIVEYNGTYTYSNGTVIGINSTMGTLVGTVLPILMVVGIILAFVSRKK